MNWLETQMSKDSIVSMNLNAVRKDAVISHVEDVLKVGSDKYSQNLLLF